MGKLKDALWDWLEETGFELGYDFENYPDISKWNDVKINKTTAREYYENYRSGSNKKTRE